MKKITNRLSKTIIETDPEQFDLKLNEFLTQIKNEPTIHFHDQTGKFSATVIGLCEVLEPESIKDEYLLQGKCYRCCDCILCKPVKNVISGLESNRICDRKKSVIKNDDIACDYFYELLDSAGSLIKD